MLWKCHSFKYFWLFITLAFMRASRAFRSRSGFGVVWNSVRLCKNWLFYTKSLTKIIQKGRKTEEMLRKTCHIFEYLFINKANVFSWYSLKKTVSHLFSFRHVNFLTKFLACLSQCLSKYLIICLWSNRCIKLIYLCRFAKWSNCQS